MVILETIDANSEDLFMEEDDDFGLETDEDDDDAVVDPR